METNGEGGGGGGVSVRMENEEVDISESGCATGRLKEEDMRTGEVEGGECGVRPKWVERSKMWRLKLQLELSGCRGNTVDG